MVGIRLGIVIMIVESRIVRGTEEAVEEEAVVEVVAIIVENTVTFLGNVRIKMVEEVEEVEVLEEEVAVEVLEEEDVLTVEKKDTFLENVRMQDLVMEAVEEIDHLVARVEVDVIERVVVVVVVVEEEEEVEVVVITVANKATFLGNVRMQDQEMEVVEEIDHLVARVEVDVRERVEAVVVILADRQDIFHENAHKQQEETEDRTRKEFLYCFLKDLFVCDCDVFQKKNDV